MKSLPTTTDPRLAAVTGDDGAISRAAVEALLSRHPRTLTLREIDAMHTVFFEVQYREDNPLAGVTYEEAWLEAFIAVLGGTVTREKVHGKTVERSVRRFRGRPDVRRYRAELQKGHSVAQPRRTARRRGAGRPRAQATRSSAESGDSGDSDSAEPSAECKAVVK